MKLSAFAKRNLRFGQNLSLFVPRGNGMIRKVLIFCIRAYQLIISPVTPPSCRFLPTCSQYAVEALEVHGPWRGLYLTIRRVLRCHPFHPGGFDPVQK